MRKLGVAVAVPVPRSELEAPVALEDQLDLLDALEALADYEVNGGVDFGELKLSLCCCGCA